MQHPYRGDFASENSRLGNSILADARPKNQAFSALPALQREIADRNLTDCLEILEWLGFQGDDTLIFLLATAQRIGGEG